MFYLSTAALLLTYFGLRAAAGQPLRPRHRRHPRERAARRTARLRSARLQARDLHHRRRARRLCRLPVRQLGHFRQPDHLRPGAIGADHHLGDRRRPRHADRADHRLHRHPVAHRSLGANAPSGSVWSSLLGNAPLVLGAILSLSCCWCPRGWCRRSATGAQSLCARATPRARGRGRGDGRAADGNPRSRMHFGGVKAVRDVNFTLAEGELRCLIGPNGAGKSTFFKMLTGPAAADLGRVLFRGTIFRRRRPTRSRGSASASRPRCRACSTA